MPISRCSCAGCVNARRELFLHLGTDTVVGRILAPKRAGPNCWNLEMLPFLEEDTFIDAIN